MTGWQKREMLHQNKGPVRHHYIKLTGWQN